MKTKIALLSFLLGSSTFAFSNGLNFEGEKTYTQWVDQNQNKITDMKIMDTKSEFSALFLIASEFDWEKDWDNPEKAKPEFKQVDTVKIGDNVNFLTFFSNPHINEKNEYIINCDLKITNSKGEVLADGKIEPCSSGIREKDLNTIFITDTPITFSPTKEDPLGEWTFKMKITDTVRNASVLIEETFNVVE